MKKRTRFFGFVLVLSSLMGIYPAASGQTVITPTPSPTQTGISESTVLLGKTLTVSQVNGPTATGNGIQSTTDVQFLGAAKPLLQAVLATSGAAPNSLAALASDTTQTYYVDGIRVWSGQISENKGVVNYTGSVPLTQITIPALMYPVGPLILELNAGISFEAQLAANLTPELSVPLQDTSITGSLQTSATASGFVDGDVRVVIFRGGLKGSVTLIDGAATVNALMFFNGQAPQLSYSGKVSALAGNVSAFVDTNLLFGSWKTIWSQNLYSWAGKCWAFGADTCATH